MPPLLDSKNPDAKSVFIASALLREARRQKGLAIVNVPSICVLDPDGDIVRHLKAKDLAHLSRDWPCYHSELYIFELAGQIVGIIGRAVGAPFAVLIAEELFASGCGMLISITSAGQITPAIEPPYFVIIDRALRDEGTSYHYAVPSEYSEADAQLIAYGCARVEGQRSSKPYWFELDYRCSVSRNRRSDRRCSVQRHSGR